MYFAGILLQIQPSRGRRMGALWWPCSVEAGLFEIQARWTVLAKSLSFISGGEKMQSSTLVRKKAALNVGSRGKKSPWAANVKGEREGEVGYFSIYWHTSILPSHFQIQLPKPPGPVAAVCTQLRAQTVWPRPAPAFPVNLSQPSPQSQHSFFGLGSYPLYLLWATAQVPPRGSTDSKNKLFLSPLKKPRNAGFCVLVGLPPKHR